MNSMVNNARCYNRNCEKDCPGLPPCKMQPQTKLLTCEPDGTTTTREQPWIRPQSPTQSKSLFAFNDNGVSKKSGGEIDMKSRDAAASTRPTRTCADRSSTCFKPPSCECPEVEDDPCELVMARLKNEDPDPVCCNNARFAMNPCAASYKKKELKETVEPFKSMWNYPKECCRNPCPEMLPRFDEMHWCPTDKLKREYQQTWIECPFMPKRKRKVCAFQDLGLPPICRRERKKPPPATAHPYDSLKMKAVCGIGSDLKCQRIQMPCCRPCRIPPRCTSTRQIQPCQKFCCPYPAYSECSRAKIKPLRQVECKCLQESSMCEVYDYLRRKLLYALGPPIPAWPPKLIGAR